MTLKNISYGFDSNQRKSMRGRDGIFLVDRDYKPRNNMQVKLFDQFIDKAKSEYSDIIGFLYSKERYDEMVLVDWDAEKG